MGSKWRSWTKISLEKTLAFRTRISLDSFATLAFDNFLVNVKSRQTIKTLEEGFDSDKIKKFLLHLQHIVFYSMCLNCIGSKLLTTNRLRKIFFVTLLEQFFLFHLQHMALIEIACLLKWPKRNGKNVPTKCSPANSFSVWCIWSPIHFNSSSKRTSVLVLLWIDNIWHWQLTKSLIHFSILLLEVMYAKLWMEKYSSEFLIMLKL